MAGGGAELGAAGEDAAARLYEARGYTVIARNWRCGLGELDLVVGRGVLLAFCEVKSRSGAGFGAGYEAVTHRKQRKLRVLAEAFLAALPEAPAPAVRFDVASVRVRPGGGVVEVEIFEDAF